MNCAISDNAISLELDSKIPYIEKVVSGSKRKGRKNKETGEQEAYYQGIVYFNKDLIDSYVACILLEETTEYNPTSMSGGKLITNESPSEYYGIKHYGIIIQKTKNHHKRQNGHDYIHPYVQLPQGWVNKRVRVYKLK